MATMTPWLRHASRVCLAALLAQALTAPAASGEGPATIDDFLGRPLVSSLTAASAAARIAWVENTRGARNLWTAAAPDFVPIKLSDNQADDGQALADLALVPDGSQLIYTRGSAPNAAGEFANPTSDPAGAEQAIWALSTAGASAPRRLAAGAGAVIVAPGTSALFARGGKVFELVLAVPEHPPTPTPETATEPPAPELLFSARGRISSLTPSPDGRHIAFVSERGDHSLIGLFDRAEHAIHWVAPSVDRDLSPTFSPTGHLLAFVRMPGARIGERFDLTQASAFSLWLTEVASGSAWQIWQSPAGAGGFAQFYPARSLAFAYFDSFLLFPSEHEGWLHLYRVSLEDGPDADGLPADEGAIDLTPGPFEIESFTVARDTETVWLWGNHGDRDRRHIYRLNAQRGGLERLGSGQGIEVEPLPFGHQQLAYRRADARTPMQIAIADASGRSRIVAPSHWPERFPRDALVVPEAVTFRAADELEIHAQLFSPPVAAAGDGGAGHPAVVFLHGGPIRQMLLGWHNMRYYANAYAFNQFLASRGFVVLSVNYRSGIGYGRDFRRAPGQGPRGASEYQDVVAAGRYLAARDDVDARRIGLWGGSYGGLLTAQALARDSDLFAAGVDLHGVHDWAFRGTDFPLPGGAWGLGPHDLALARRSSPVAAVDTWRSPVLFVHGDDDRNVLFQQTTDLVQRLRARGVHVETLVLPDEVHGFLRYQSWLRTFRAAFDFLQRSLAAPSEPPAPSPGSAPGDPQ